MGGMFSHQKLHPHYSPPYHTGTTEKAKKEQISIQNKKRGPCGTPVNAGDFYYLLLIAVFDFLRIEIPLNYSRSL
jgi:hypothetical protein